MPTVVAVLDVFVVAVASVARVPGFVVSVVVVIATDVASRGLDIKGIERVINYELPQDNFMDYVR